MGAGIANVTIDKGIKTTLIDVSQDGLDRGVKQIAAQINGQQKRKKITSAEKGVILSNLHPALNYSGLKTADVVVEAVFEELSLKHKIVKDVSKEMINFYL